MGLFIASPFSPHLKTALIRTQEALRTRGVRRQFTGGTPAAIARVTRKSIFGHYNQTSETKPKRTLNKHGIITCVLPFGHCFDPPHRMTRCHYDGKLISLKGNGPGRSL